MARNKVAHDKVMIRNRMETFYRFTLNAMSEGYRKRVEFMNWLQPCLGAMTLRCMLAIVAVKLRGSMHEVAL
jgi:hypothetical protein